MKTKLVGLHNFKKQKPGTGNPGWRVQRNMRSEYRKKGSLNNQRGQTSSPTVPLNMDAGSSGDFQVLMSSTAASNKKESEKMKHIMQLTDKIEKRKPQILQRKLLAWPTFRESNGFGNDGTNVVGSAMSQQDDVGDYDTGVVMPPELSQFQQDHVVKSAVGSARASKHLPAPSGN